MFSLQYHRFPGRRLSGSDHCCSVELPKKGKYNNRFRNCFCIMIKLHMRIDGGLTEARDVSFFGWCDTPYLVWQEYNLCMWLRLFPANS